MNPQKINDYSFLIEPTGSMLVPLKIFASDLLLEQMLTDKCIQQGMNVACLPGIQGWSIMMPDAHQGYGFSIGGVAAFDMSSGVISPGGIGFDINCGVRVVATSLQKQDLEGKMPALLDALFQAVPSGMGTDSTWLLTDDELEAILSRGAPYLVEQGIGSQQDLDCCEEGGFIEGANSSFVPRRAKSRGRKQIGTLGSGNHFLEVQYAHEIFDKETATRFGITSPDQVVLMIHCGSRGLGHEVASHFLRRMEEEYPELVAALPEKDLAYAPLDSVLGKEYYGAMCAAANFAFANRHYIAHKAHLIFQEFFEGVTFHTVYDVAHNIAKRETHVVDGEHKEVMVHRKGATRAFGPGRKELPEVYQETGQPVLIPGSMGTSSYVLVGTQDSMEKSFGSTAHGAGRCMSRYQAKQEFDGPQLQKDLLGQNIHLKTGSLRGVADEAPGAYKDVDEVVRVSDLAGIGKVVVKLKPLGVIKG